MSRKNNFRNVIGENIFYHKYAQGQNDTWYNLALRVVNDVCGSLQGERDPLLSNSEREQLVELIYTFKFLPGGRYLYYAGRKAHFWNNCYLLRAEEDSREEWGRLCRAASDCLMSGGGIGIDYSRLREAGLVLSRTGGLSSGPIPLMCSINEIGRNVMQGGSRRSAIYGSLNWRHGDIHSFLKIKDWRNHPIGAARNQDGTPYTLADVKHDDFNFPAPLDMTNISVNYDDDFLASCGEGTLPDTFLENCKQAMMTGEPGFSFNFFEKEEETLRNACTEVTSEDDSDVCNLGSLNLANFENLEEFRDAVDLCTRFLLCGSLRSDLPYSKVYEVRARNRRLGLGLMGVHEWLMKRGSSYEATPEFKDWLEVYEKQSDKASREMADWVGCTRPVAVRAIAPTGSIAMLAGTTSGIEPLYAVAYKRRYLVDGTKWKYEYVIDSTAQGIIEEDGVDPEKIETAISMEEDYEKRIKLQADVQDYVDMAISSTINLPKWGSRGNNEDKVAEFAEVLARFSPRLRGFTCYPDGSRGGQPITQIDYKEALNHKGVVYEENDICDISSRGGICGS